MKFDALSKFFDQVIEGTIDISRASLDAKLEILKVPESERPSLNDDVRVGDAGHAGFNPHEGMDLNHHLKHGLNPHAAGHPGASDTSAAASSTVFDTASTSTVPEAVSVSSGSSAEPDTTVAAKEHHPEPAKEPVVPAAEHAKDEL